MENHLNITDEVKLWKTSLEATKEYELTCHVKIKISVNRRVICLREGECVEYVLIFIVDLV